MRFLRFMLIAPFLLGLSACHAVVLDPSGDIAIQQRDLLINSALLMLVIIIPVMLLTVGFAYYYRQSNKKAQFEPEWDHSILLELVIWAGPLFIVICLGAMTWLSAHLLDPYHALGRIAPNKAVTQDIKPLEIDVVSLDWKWLFIFPQYGIASVNDLALPIDRPINFHITSASVMNSFYIPALAGQIYAMAGMETILHAVLNKAGDFKGFSANYSGAGFSGMDFPTHGLSAHEFEQWIAGIKKNGSQLTRESFLKLAEPSEKEPAHYYAVIDGTLYSAILNFCVKPGTACMSMMKGMEGASGEESKHSSSKPHEDKRDDDMSDDMPDNMPMNKP